MSVLSNSSLSSRARTCLLYAHLNSLIKDIILTILKLIAEGSTKLASVSSGGGGGGAPAAGGAAAGGAAAEEKVEEKAEEGTFYY